MNNMTEPTNEGWVNKQIGRLSLKDSIEVNGVTYLGVKDVADLLTEERAKAEARGREQQIDAMCAMPDSVTITIVAKDAEHKDAIRKVLTLDSISKSSGVALKRITEDAIRAMVESTVIKKAIGWATLSTEAKKETT